jgi:hypothetical protein
MRIYRRECCLVSEGLKSNETCLERCVDSDSVLAVFYYTVEYSDQLYNSSFIMQFFDIPVKVTGLVTEWIPRIMT